MAARRSRRSARTSAAFRAGALAGTNPYWISRIEASHFEPGDGVRRRRRPPLATICDPYVFVTHDYGKTFPSVSGNLPPVRQRAGGPRGSEEPRPALRRNRVRAVRVARRREALGAVHERLPTVRTDDILVHPRDGRPHRGDARAQPLDRGRHHAARSSSRRRRGAGRGAVRRASRDRVRVRLPQRRVHRRRQGVRGRESGQGARRSSTTSSRRHPGR